MEEFDYDEYEHEKSNRRKGRSSNGNENALLRMMKGEYIMNTAEYILPAPAI